MLNTIDYPTMLKTSLVREDLFTWLERLDVKPIQVDTWTIADHPAPDGQTFDLYVMHLILPKQTREPALATYTPSEMLSWMNEGMRR